MSSDNNCETLLASPGELPPRIFIISSDTLSSAALSGIQSFGRSTGEQSADISSLSRTVSRRHGLFRELSDGRTEYLDCGSTFGTLYNGSRLSPYVPVLLQDGDVLRVHGEDDPGCASDVLAVYSRSYIPGAQWRVLKLSEDMAELAVGRQDKLSLGSPAASRHHASFFHASGGWAIIDRGSLNGVRLNGRRISSPEYLRPMDVLCIAGYLFIFTGDRLIYQYSPQEERPCAPAAPSPAPSGMFSAPAAAAGGKKRGLFSVPDSFSGRASSGPAAREATAPSGSDAGENMRGLFSVPDSFSGKDCAGGPVQDISDGEGLSIRIEERNVWHRAKKKTLLRDISLEISPGSMVLVLGGSGAGKTTLLNAVMGYEQASGEISYRGMDIYEEYELMKYEIGYVPQQDLLRMNDTVYDTLLGAAQMRLPAGLSPGEQEERVEHTAGMLGLSRELGSLVGKLSGGQRKRLSIAVEYIGDPSLFFLDEPDSGLDGTMARALMENLRTIADQGRIVILISHAPDRAYELFDRVIVLAKDSREDCGRLAFYGSPDEACAFFGTDSLEQIVRRINRPDEGGEGMADYYIDLFEKRGQRHE